MKGVGIALVRFVVITVTMSVWSSSYAIADGKNDFLSCYVADFARPSERRHVTSARQREMLERRRGTYVADLGEVSGRVSSQLGKEVRRFFVDIADDKRAKLVFECADGEHVSSKAFLAGRMSDLSFRWDSPGSGVVAWYGVLGDCLPIIFCPRTHPMKFVMKRWNGTLDLQKLRIAASLGSPFEGKARAEDVFNLVCETEKHASGCRLRAKSQPHFGECATNLEHEIVACYCTENVPAASVSLYGRPHSTDALQYRYWVLQADGGISLVYGDGKNRFRWRPGFEYPWWEEFDGMPYGVYSTLYDVHRDEIAVITSPYALSMEIDRRIVSPRSFERKETELGGKTLGQRLDETLAWHCENPERILSVRVYRRIKNIDKNGELRRKLKDATRLKEGVVYD